VYFTLKIDRLYEEGKGNKNKHKNEMRKLYRLLSDTTAAKMELGPIPVYWTYLRPCLDAHVSISYHKCWSGLE
jgi:hypothetical protein